MSQQSVESSDDDGENGDGEVEIPEWYPETAEKQTVDFPAVIQSALERAQVAEEAEWDEPDAQDPHVFHASQLALCRRQCYVTKHRLRDQSDALVYFRAGTLIHEFIEDHVAPLLSDYESEVEGVIEEDGLEVRGRADLLGESVGRVYDLKSRGGWYKFDPPTQRHLDQLHVYMRMFDVSEAQVVYISRNNWDIRTYPSDGVFRFDAEAWQRMKRQAISTRNVVQAQGVAEEADEIPFDKCGCFLCNSETLDFAD